MENISEIKHLLTIPKYIVITSHRNPDGDAIGSSLGLYHYLNQLGHTVRMILPSDYPPAFAWMHGINDIIIFDLDPDASKQAIAYADVIFCLDYNALDRVDKVGELIADRPTAVKIMIDHHLDPEPFMDYSLSDTTASSTCELVYDFITLLGDTKRLNPIIGECLYTGIVTDTGSFKYATSAKLFRTVAALKELGIDDYYVQDAIFNSLVAKNLRLLGHCLHNRMEILPEYKTGIISLTKQDYVDFDIQRGDTEGIVNYLLMLREIKIAALITEQPTIVKFSLRSKGDFSVQEICRKHFNGGGHKNASGGHLHISLHGAIRKFKEVLPVYKDKLNHA